MKKNYKILIIALLFFTIAIAALGSFLFYCKPPVLVPENFSDYKTEEIKIGGNIIKVEIADTKEKREKGLSGRQSLSENSGMLFIFDHSDYYSFWMKDMNFELDFIWMNGSEIIEITRNVRPEDYQPASTRLNQGTLRPQSEASESLMSLFPKNKVDKVLEVNAGAAERLGIKVGDRIEFN